MGLCLSLTNYSLVPQEMMACGLPCVDLAGGSTEAELGATRAWSTPRPTRWRWPTRWRPLIDDAERWERRSQAGLAMADTASWDVAARQVEAGLREALREQELAAAGQR